MWKFTVRSTAFYGIYDALYSCINSLLWISREQSDTFFVTLARVACSLDALVPLLASCLRDGAGDTLVCQRKDETLMSAVRLPPYSVAERSREICQRSRLVCRQALQRLLHTQKRVERSVEILQRSSSGRGRHEERAVRERVRAPFTPPTVLTHFIYPSRSSRRARGWQRGSYPPLPSVTQTRESKASTYGVKSVPTVRGQCAAG
jgi:hypothetical protein